MYVKIMLRLHDKAPTWTGDNVEDRLKICLQFLKSCEIISEIEKERFNEKMQNLGHGQNTSGIFNDSVTSSELFNRTNHTGVKSCECDQVDEQSREPGNTNN